MRFLDIRRELLVQLYERGALTKQTAVAGPSLLGHRPDADPTRLKLVLKDLEDTGIVLRHDNRYFLTVNGACEAEKVAQTQPAAESAGKDHKIAIISLIISIYVALIAFLPGTLSEAFDSGCGYVHGYRIKDGASFYCTMLRDSGNNPNGVEDLLTSFWFWLIALGLLAMILVARQTGLPRRAH